MSNLEYAQKAIDYVTNTCRLGANNRDEGFNVADGKGMKKMRDEHRAKKVTPGTQDEIIQRATIAKKHKAGNCMEQVSIAYEFLTAKQIDGLALMKFEGLFDHIFLFVGVGGIATGNQFQLTLGAPPPAPWTQGDAVVCDPWYHEWFSIATDWNRKLGPILAETLSIDKTERDRNVWATFRTLRDGVVGGDFGNPPSGKAGRYAKWKADPLISATYTLTCYYADP